MYAITGATGHTGSIIADRLLAKGEKVRVLGRDARRLERFTQKGAEPFALDIVDVGALTKAFSSATAVYAMIPPNPASPDIAGYQETVSDALAAAIEKSGVTRVVALSSIGADKPDRTGPVVGLHNLEKKLERISGLENALYIRAGYFMENFLGQVGVIQSFGHVAGPIRPDLPLPLIAARDIGAFAAEALEKGNFSGKHARELQGARDVTYLEAAGIIGTAIGKPSLSYIQLPPAQLKPALMQMGMSASMADLLLQMADALNSGYMKPLEPRSPENTTPTTFETFVAQEFVPAYQGKAARA